VVVRRTSIRGGPRRGSRWPTRAAALLLGGVALAATEWRLAEAAITAVDLSLTSVQTISGANARLLRYEGGLLGRALVQNSYPLHLVVFEQGRGDYVRFAVDSGAVRGSAPDLVDGATSAESLALLGEGEPLPGARLTFVDDRRIEVLIPAYVLSGSLEAFAFAVYEGAALVSNTVPVEEVTP
jgi:hypothetical protein